MERLRRFHLFHVRRLRLPALHLDGPAGDPYVAPARPGALAGRAFEVEDPKQKAAYGEEVEPPEPFHLFRTELTEVVRTYVEDDKYLVVQIWQPGMPLRTIKRT